MIVRTVGELKSALAQFSDDMPLDFATTFADNGRIHRVVTDRNEVPCGDGIALECCNDGKYFGITNLYAYDLVLED